MKERPILFSAPMVRAILDGRKTQTRRMVKFDGSPAMMCGMNWCETRGNGWTWYSAPPEEFPEDYRNAPGKQCPHGVPGDRLFVREQTWKHKETNEYRHSDAASDASWKECGWKKVPGIHMPRQMSRITLEITEVRVQRLNEISEEDAKAEGVEHGNVPGYDIDINGEVWNGAYKRAYSRLWDQINGPGSWAKNPWVWAITFNRVTAAVPTESEHGGSDAETCRDVRAGDVRDVRGNGEDSMPDDIRDSLHRQFGPADATAGGRASDSVSGVQGQGAGDVASGINANGGSTHRTQADVRSMK